MHESLVLEGIGKRYRIGLKESLDDSLLGAAYSLLRSPVDNFRNLKKLAYFKKEEEGDDLVWALRDVNLKVQEGEVVGVVGGNGAGKSTLLKILSKITEPTTGRVKIRGRTASLLEVGTGFHPELTGRENIFLNGTILGMKGWEIRSRFNEIADFSGVGKFIDTPVKRYSSGMKVRLAFSVAAFLDPEILFIDEVLAVGDIEFQSKCLGKMDELSHSGRTIFFVSHNMAAVSSLCTKAVLIEKGTLVEEGPVDGIISSYISRQKKVSQDLSEADRSGNGQLIIEDIIFESDSSNASGYMCSGSRVEIRLKFRCEVMANVVFGINFFGNLGVQMFQAKSSLSGKVYPVHKGSGEVRCIVPKLPLVPGEYTVSVWAKSSSDLLDSIEHAASLSVHEGDFFGSGKLPHNKFRGVLVDQEWR